MVDVSNQTGPHDVRAENHRGVDGPVAEAAHTFLELTAPFIDTQSMEHAPFMDTQSMQHERTLQELADAKAEIARKDEQIELNKGLLAEMTESRDQQTQQRNELQT